MSAAEYRAESGDDLAEGVPVVVTDSIASWRRVLSHATAENAADLLFNGAHDLFRTRRICNVQRPECDALTNQTIVDALYDMAVTAGVDDDQAQSILVKASAESTVPRPAQPADQYMTPEQRAAEEPRPTLLSKAQFLARYTQPDWLVDGILQRGFIYSLTARTGDGKTAVALLIAQLVAATDRLYASLGGPHPVEAGTVIYFAGENPDDLRYRMIAADAKAGRDCSADRISVISGTFPIKDIRSECEAKIAALGGSVNFIVVDTSAAYFFGDNENDNPQAGAHARMLRTLTTLPGKPCVLVLAHPVKNPTEQSHLLPRGGGAFIAEIDGNLTLWRTDDVTELYHTGKLRGPGFEPIAFRLERVLCDALLDTKGRPSPTVLAAVITDADKDELAHVTRSNEDRLLIAILEKPRSIADLAKACGWVSSSGDPQKSRAHRTLKGLERSGLVKKGRGDIYELTDKGKAAAIAAAKDGLQ